MSSYLHTRRIKQNIRIPLLYSKWLQDKANKGNNKIIEHRAILAKRVI